MWDCLACRCCIRCVHAERKGFKKIPVPQQNREIRHEMVQITSMTRNHLKVWVLVFHSSFSLFLFLFIYLFIYLFHFILDPANKSRQCCCSCWKVWASMTWSTSILWTRRLLRRWSWRWSSSTHSVLWITRESWQRYEGETSVWQRFFVVFALPFFTLAQWVLCTLISPCMGGFSSFCGTIHAAARHGQS